MAKQCNELGTRGWLPSTSFLTTWVNGCSNELQLGPLRRWQTAARNFSMIAWAVTSKARRGRTRAPDPRGPIPDARSASTTKISRRVKLITATNIMTQPLAMGPKALGAATV